MRMLSTDRSPGFKLGLAIFVAFLLSFPLFMVWLLVYDRQHSPNSPRRGSPKAGAGRRSISGPLLVIPYRADVTETVTENGAQVTRTRQVVAQLTLAPEASQIEHRDPRPSRAGARSTRSSVYEAAISGRARFAMPADLARLGRRTGAARSRPRRASLRAQPIRAGSAPIPGQRRRPAAAAAARRRRSGGRRQRLLRLARRRAAGERADPGRLSPMSSAATARSGSRRAPAKLAGGCARPGRIRASRAASCPPSAGSAPTASRRSTGSAISRSASAGRDRRRCRRSRSCGAVRSVARRAVDLRRRRRARPLRERRAPPRSA